MIPRWGDFKNCVILIAAMLLTGTVPSHCLANDQPFSPTVAQKGVLDLRQVNLEAQPVALHGEWRFYWNQLFQPVEPAGSSPVFIAYPSLWRDNIIDGKSLSSQGYATYSLTILLPKARPKLALEIPDVYCSYSLYVNGVLLAQNGRPGRSAKEAVPFWTTQNAVIPTGSDTLNILLQVANFWHNKGGTYKEILIGEKEKLLLKHHRDIAFDLILAGCLFMGGLFFFGFYVFGKRDRAILYFSLFCIVYSYRMIGTDLYVLHSVFPHLSWFFTIRMEYFCLSVAVILFALYIRCLYPEDARPWVIKPGIWFCILYALSVITLPPLIFTKGLTLFLAVMFFYIGFAFFVCIRAVKFRRVGATFALLSCGVMLLVFLIINLHYFGYITPEKWLLFAGYVIFFFLQSLVLSHRFASTLQKAAYEAQQGLRAKTEFLSTMSHEIRTPLNVVIGMAHLLLRSNPRKEQEKNLNVLLFSANNLLSIVNDILDYNKIEAGKITFEAIPMDIYSIARNIIGGLENKAVEKQIDIRVETDNGLTKKIMGDPTRTSQVIYNLVHNAIKFTEQGSVILAVKTEQVTDTIATITLSVKDTGIGIPPEKHQLIFERFTQADSSTSRSYGGTGLGLAITKRILGLQDVELHLESEPGKGSVFYFTQSFPLSDELIVSEEQEITNIKSGDKQLAGFSLLVVEDNPFNVMVAQSLLERSGALVDVAINGAEALEKVRPGKYHMILMDLNMPVMDGYEATRQLRMRGEVIPIIALTATLPNEVERDVHEAGLTDIVVKPFNPEELLRVILPYLHPPAV